MITAQLQLSLKGISLAKVALTNPSPAARAELQSVYQTFTRERFDKASEGGAGWKPLKKGSPPILRKTGEMREGLSIELTLKPKTVARLKNRKAHSKAKMPIEKLLTIHHYGLGRVPERRILVQPDVKTATRMALIRIRAVKKALSK